MRLLMVQLALFIVVFVTITYYVETFINENAALMYPFLLILIYIFYDILFDIWFNNQELSKGEKKWIILMTEISCCIVMVSSVNFEEKRLAIGLVLAYMISAHFPYTKMINADIRKAIGIKHLLALLKRSIVKIKNIMVLEKTKRNSFIFGIFMTILFITLEKYYDYFITVINGIKIGTGISIILLLILFWGEKYVLKFISQMKKK